MSHSIVISAEMRILADYLEENCPGICFCITEKGDNLIIEVAKSELDTMVTALQLKYDNVAPLKLAYPMLSYLHHFILVKPMVTEAPIISMDGVVVPTIEKTMVDLLSDKEYTVDGQETNMRRFLQLMETCPIHVPRLLRYAARKGKKEEVLKLLNDKTNN